MPVTANDRLAGSRRTGARLNQEWETLRGQAAVWMSPSPSLEMVLQSIRFNPDRVLGGLLAACQAGYDLAGRVIVQALLPKLVLQSRAYPYPQLDDLLAQLWIRIAHYRLDRRPQAVAANLVMDARKDAVGEVRASGRCVLVGDGFEQTWAAPPASPISLAGDAVEDEARTVIAVARQLRLATAESLSIVESVYIDGLPGRQVAEKHAISAEAVRRRCSDTLRRLRDHREDLLEAM